MSDYKRLTKKSWHDTKFAQLNPREVLYKLWQLENQIENSTLKDMPCKVGDTVYTVEYSHYYNHWFIDKHEITEIIIDKNDIYLKDWYGVYLFEPFITKAEAEAKLEELRGGNND